MHGRWRGRPNGRPGARRRRRGCRGGRRGCGTGLGGLPATGQGCRHQQKRAKTSHEISSSQGLLVVGRFVAGFIGGLVAGLARREIVEVDGGVLVLGFIAERVVDAVVGLRADWALGATLRGALVHILLLALGRRVGTEVALARPWRRWRAATAAEAAFARATVSRTRATETAGKRARSTATASAVGPRTGAGRAALARLRLFHGQRAAAERLVVQLRNCFLRVIVVAVLHEGEAARAARLAIGGQIAIRDRSDGAEVLA